MRHIALEICPVKGLNVETGEEYVEVAAYVWLEGEDVGIFSQKAGYVTSREQGRNVTAWWPPPRWEGLVRVLCEEIRDDSVTITFDPLVHIHFETKAQRPSCLATLYIDGDEVGTCTPSGYWPARRLPEFWWPSERAQEAVRELCRLFALQ